MSENRRYLDQYPTVKGMTEVLIESMVNRPIPDAPFSGTAWEPCAGDGVIVDALRQSGTFGFVDGSDIDPKYDRWGYDLIDMSKPLEFVGRSRLALMSNWQITNPPFIIANQVMENMKSCSTVGMCALLRMTIEEPTKEREKFLRENADHLVRKITFGQSRPNFRKGEINPKTGKPYRGDSVTTAWYVWAWDFSWARLGIPSPFEYATKWAVK